MPAVSTRYLSGNLAMSYIRSIPSTLEETVHHFITSFTKLPIFTLQNLVVIGTDYTCICKSNYHTITATAAPYIIILSNKMSSVRTNSYMVFIQAVRLYVHTLLYVFYSYPHCSWMMFIKGGWHRDRERMWVGISVYQY